LTEEVAVVKEEGKLQDLKQAGRISVSPTESMPVPHLALHVPR
jgi:hypothetical protein